MKIDHIRETLAVHPEQHSLKVSENRWSSFLYALAGCLYMLRYAKNIRLQALATGVVLPLGLWLGLTRLEWAVIVLVIGVNWFAEFTNAAIEAAVNIASPDYHAMAQVAKDVAAGAVLLTSAMAVIVGILLLVLPALERLT